MTVQDDLVLLAAYKEQAKDLATLIGEVEKRITDAMDLKRGPDQKSVTMTVHGLRATGVFGTTVTIDPDGLKGELTAAMWKRVTKQVLDKEMLEAHMATGDIDPNVVAQHSEEKPNKPYVRFSGKYEPPKPTPTARKVRPTRKRASA